MSYVITFDISESLYYELILSLEIIQIIHYKIPVVKLKNCYFLYDSTFVRNPRPCVKFHFRKGKKMKLFCPFITRCLLYEVLASQFQFIVKKIRSTAKKFVGNGGHRNNFELILFDQEEKKLKISKLRGRTFSYLRVVFASSLNPNSNRNASKRTSVRLLFLDPQGPVAPQMLISITQGARPSISISEKPNQTTC